MTNLLFLIIGNFITCSYARNFTVFDLLRKPLVFKGIRQENFYLINVPKGLPWEESVLSIENDFCSKLKDLAIKKGQKEADKNNTLVIIDAQALDTMLYFSKKLSMQSCNLIYSPWYRFVSEPFKIGDINSFSEHIGGVFLYSLQQQSVKADLIKKSDSEDVVVLESNYYGFNEIVITKDNGLKKLSLRGGTGSSELDFVEKKILLNKGHDLLLFDALVKVGDGDLKNIKINKTDKDIELSYEK